MPSMTPSAASLIIAKLMLNDEVMPMALACCDMAVKVMP
jgi:hypothetical protein